MDALIGSRIQLRPLRHSDSKALALAAADGKLWDLPYTTIPSPDTVEGYVRTALEEQAAGTVLPFVIELLNPSTIVGSTRFLKIDQPNRKLEIGGTWIAAKWQRTFVNSEAKLLMLQYAFESLGCVRVQFTTDELNEKSRHAILRLGAKQEGIIRNERIMPNGRKRHSVRFSIIDDEWPKVKRRLISRLAELPDT
jgi:RimJ/RimL family protein N-acetyltransferase